MTGRSRICRSYEDLVGILPQWSSLVARSEANVFYEPSLLLPAFKHLAAGSQPFFVLVFDDATENRLIGFFPTARLDTFRRMPMRHFANWKYEHAFYGAPLIEIGREDDCIREYLAALQDEEGSVCSFCFELLDQESTLFRLLDQRRGFTNHVESYQRAQLDIRRYDPTQVLTGKHRKDLRRRERRLGDLGELTTHFDEAGTNLPGWIEDFLVLEAGGWKGRNGTAMTCNAHDRRFFVEATRALGETGRLQVTSLRLDGRLIASTCDLVSGDRAFAFKIAYDEELGQFSPGIIVVMKHAERLSRDGRLRWADSCAQADSEMANRLYTERRTMSAIMLSRGATAAGLVTSHVLPAVRAATARLARAASSVGGGTAKK